MIQKISAVLSDVDGTLVNEEKVVTARAQEAVRRLADAGIAFAVTSGRPPRGMKMFIEPLKITTPIAGFNGGTFVKPDMSIIEEHMLSPEMARRSVDVILQHKMDVWVYTADKWFVRDLKAPHVEREEWTVKFAPTVVAGFDDLLTKAVKIVGVSDDVDLVAQCEKDTSDACGEDASAVRSQPYYLDVTHPSANKGTVVTTLAKLLSIPAAEIVTIGDGQNDVLMFKKSGMSIAMGNAHADVQKQATYVAESHKDDGFAKAIERYVLGHAEPASKAS